MFSRVKLNSFIERDEECTKIVNFSMQQSLKRQKLVMTKLKINCEFYRGYQKLKYNSESLILSERERRILKNDLA